MKINSRHRKVARAIWISGGQVDEVAAAHGLREATIRRWLTVPAFRALLAEDLREPLLQATSAVVRWAPAAVSRLIRDLEGDSPGDARQAAREILRLAIEAERDLSGWQAARAETEGGEPLSGLPDDPLMRRVAGLSDAQLERVFSILNTPGGEPEGEEGDER